MASELKTLCQYLPVKISGSDEVELTGISADSRSIKPGFLFAALPGSAVDGADFTGMAVENGATVILLLREVMRKFQMA